MITALLIGAIIGLLILSILNRDKINDLQEQINFNDKLNHNNRIHILERETGIQKKDFWYRTYTTDSEGYGRRFHHMIYFGFNHTYSNYELNKIYKDDVLFYETFTLEEAKKVRESHPSTWDSEGGDGYVEIWEVNIGENYVDMKIILLDL